jgi:type I site-specific restriction-modification system R (restriction) subunit
MEACLKYLQQNNTFFFLKSFISKGKKSNKTHIFLRCNGTKIAVVIFEKKKPFKTMVVKRAVSQVGFFSDDF